MDFRWNEWNSEHIAQHGVSTGEAEAIVQRATRPFPRRIDDDKWIVWGPESVDDRCKSFSCSMTTTRFL